MVTAIYLCELTLCLPLPTAQDTTFMPLWLTRWYSTPAQIHEYHYGVSAMCTYCMLGYL